MEGRLGKTIRHPQMKLLVDFNNVGYDLNDQWVDITDDILEINGSKEKSSNQIGSITSDIANFIVDNIDKKYSNDNTNSPLFGKIKSNLKFRLLTGFQGETLVPYASGYIDKFVPTWKDKKISIQTTDYFKLFKETPPPEESFQDISWDALVNILCDHVGLPSFIVRNIPKTEFHYSYIKFEEDNCFESLKSLMEAAVGEAYFEQEQFFVKTKLALDYQLDTTVDHDITVDDLLDFDEDVDGENIINSVKINAQYKALGPLAVVFETPENVVKVENEILTYDGSGSVYVSPDNLPIVHDVDTPVLLTNLTQQKNIMIDGYVPETGRFEIDPSSLPDVATGDTLIISYSYQQLALLAGKTRVYTLVLKEEADSLQSLDIAVWDENGNQKRVFSATPDVVNTVSQQSMVLDTKTNTVTLTLKNNYSTPITISTLQLQGYPVKVLTPMEVVVSDQASIDEFGRKEVEIQNNYLNNVKLAEKIAQYIVDNNKSNRKRVSIEIPAYPEFSLDDVAKVTEDDSGTNHNFTIERIDYTFTPDGGWSAKSPLLELDTAPWVYESFKGESWQKTNSGTPDSDFLKDIFANMIKNGGAELYTGFSDSEDIGAIDQKHIVPDYWNFERTLGDASARIRDGGNLVLHGLHSFEVTTTNSGAGYFEQIVNGIKTNSTYILSFIASLTDCSGKASVLQYNGSTLLQTDAIDITSDNEYELMITSLANTTAIIVRFEKLAGTVGIESFVFDKVKFENAKEKTPYIESEETSSIQVGQRYANSLVLGNNYGIEVFDELNNTKVRLGQYEPGKYGLKIYQGAIEIVGGLPTDQINVGSGSSFEDGYDPSTKQTFYYGDVEPVDKTVIWIDTSGEEDVWKRWDATTSTWKTGPGGPQGIEGPAGADGQTMYTWVKYADDNLGNGMSEYPDGKKYIGLAYNKTVSTESSAASDYTWSLIQGDQGIPGEPGADGTTYYTWLKYADSPTSGMSDDPTGKYYMGIAYNKTSPTESLNYADYSWSKIKGEPGKDGYTPIKGVDYFDGKDGIDGADGVSGYLWIKYSTNPDGNPMTDSPTGALYIGVATTTTPTAPTGYASYKWSLIKGSDGLPGEPGADGQTSYLHIKYSDDGASFTANNGETPGAYIGTYVDFTQSDSLDFSKYTWNKVKGEDGYTPIKGVDYFDGQDGQNGQDGSSAYLWVKYSVNPDGNPMTDNPAGALYIGVATTTTATMPASYTSYKWSLIKGTDGLPGEPGTDGKTSYLHIKYSNDGGVTFTANSGETVGDWIGTYVDFNSADSTSVSAYTWNKIRGDQGLPGEPGADGQPTYVWVKYADSPTTGMSDLPDGKIYIGFAYNKSTPTESNTYSDYAWSLIEGPQGAPGDDGITYYTWLKYADSPTTGMSDSPTGKTYMGVAFNKTTPTESTNYADYSWSLIKGDKGDPGNDGIDGNDGKGVTSIVEQYYLSTSNTTQTGGAWSPTVPTWADGKYIWTRSVITYTDSTTTTTNPVCVTGGKGSTGNDGVGVTKVDVQYYLSTSSTSLSGGSWSTTAPAWVDGKYMWSKTVTTYTNGTTTESAAVCITGAKGQTGSDGNPAKAASVIASTLAFKSADGGATYSPSSLTLTPELQNVSFSKWQYSTNGGVTWTDVVSGSTSGCTISGGVLTLTNASTLFGGTIGSVVFKLITNVGTIYTTVTIMKMFDIKGTYIDSNGIYTGSIGANQIDANQLSAISADLGTVTAGNITGVTITGSTITSTIDTDTYTTMQGGYVESRGQFTRTWRGVTTNNDVKLKFENGYFRAQNDTMVRSLFYSDYGISTQLDATDTSGALEFFSKFYSAQTVNNGVTLFSDAGIVGIVSLRNYVQISPEWDNAGNNTFSFQVVDDPDSSKTDGLLYYGSHVNGFASGIRMSKAASDPTVYIVDSTGARGTGNLNVKSVDADEVINDGTLTLSSRTGFVDITPELDNTGDNTFSFEVVESTDASQTDGQLYYGSKSGGYASALRFSKAASDPTVWITDGTGNRGTGNLTANKITAGNVYMNGTNSIFNDADYLYLNGKGVRLVDTGTNGATFTVTHDSTGPRVYSVEIYNRTYAQSTTTLPMLITSAGTLGRENSATKYKLNIQDADSLDLAKRILDVRVKTWFDKRACEEYSEYLTKIDKGEKISPHAYDDLQPVEKAYGLVAEDLQKVGLDMFVIGPKNANGVKEVEGLMYNRLWVLLIPVIRDLVQRIEILENAAKTA